MILKPRERMSQYSCYDISPVANFELGLYKNNERTEKDKRDTADRMGPRET